MPIIGDLISTSPVAGGGGEQRQAGGGKRAVAGLGKAVAGGNSSIEETGVPAIWAAFQPDLEVLLLYFELRDGVLLHQVNDGLDIF